MFVKHPRRIGLWAMWSWAKLWASTREKIWTSIRFLSIFKLTICCSTLPGWKLHSRFRSRLSRWNVSKESRALYREYAPSSRNKDSTLRCIPPEILCSKLHSVSTPFNVVFFVLETLSRCNYAQLRSVGRREYDLPGDVEDRLQENCREWRRLSKVWQPLGAARVSGFRPGHWSQRLRDARIAARPQPVRGTQFEHWAEDLRPVSPSDSGMLRNPIF